MSQYQSGILPENCRFAIYLEADVPGQPGALRQGIQAFQQHLAGLQQQFPDAELGAVVAFGQRIWRLLNGVERAPELKNFQPLGHGKAPATQHDLLIHVQSLRQDVNFSLAQAAMAAWGDVIVVAEETHGFRAIENRDLSGFVDGTENPQGEQRQSVAIIANGADAGGSYVLTQRWEHNLQVWQRVPESEQEQIIGRTKVSNNELDAASRPQTSHLSRVDLKEKGQGLKILRQSLPYGTASGTHGLFFIAYCATLHNIEQLLLSMFGESDGKVDAMLHFTRPVTGSYYFAPSLDTLLAL